MSGMARRPTVGVTGPDRGGAVAWEMTRLALKRAGADALRVTSDAPHSIDGLDGLVVGGGADIDPTLYRDRYRDRWSGDDETMGHVMEVSAKQVQQNRTPALSLLLAPGLYLMRKVFEIHTQAGPDPRRDDLERRLLDGALSRGIPILGICRGMQLLNVQLGGTLHEDVAGFYVEFPQVRTVLPRKLVQIDPESRLARVIGNAPCNVNALHHQAIRGLGEGLSIVARENNGIAQAIEQRSARFVIGVQWHPEYIPQHRRQQALFEALVDAA